MTTKVRSTQVPTGRYVQGGATVVLNNSLGWWERRYFAPATSDVEIELTGRYHKRPDLLAFDVYGLAGLQWVILQYNSIVDINEEFVQGKKVLVPSNGRVQSEFLSRTSTTAPRT